MWIHNYFNSTYIIIKYKVATCLMDTEKETEFSNLGIKDTEGMVHKIVVEMFGYYNLIYNSK